MDEKFRQQILRYDKHKHKFKVTNSNGSKEAWRWLKKNKWLGLPPITEKDFGAIINSVNKLHQDRFMEGKDIVFPHYMGRIELRKRESSVRMIDGNLKVDTPIDWKSTLELWFEDEDCRNKKQLVRRNPGFVYIIRYDKNKAKYNNKAFYKFYPARSFKERLKDTINKGNIDAFLYTEK